MSLGLGVFLSSCFLGIIFLFIATKDRWRWKKIIILPLCIVFVLGSIAGAGFYIYNLYEKKPKTYHAYQDIPLNASESDLIFLKGQNSYKKYTKDKSTQVIAYTSEDKNIFIRIKDDKVWRISCHSETSYDCSALNKTSLFDLAGDVKEKLGEPDHVHTSDDDTNRMWVFEKYNIYMMLSKGKVDSIGIFEPKLGIPEFNDVQYHFQDLTFNDKKVKEIPIFENEKGERVIDKSRLNDVLAATAKGDEVIWSEYIALETKRAEALENIRERLAVEEKARRAKADAEELAKLEREEKAKKQAQSKLKAKAAEMAKSSQPIEPFKNDNWQKIKKGMAEYQIKKLLGEPNKIEGAYWYYSEDRREGAHLFFTWNNAAKVYEVWSFKVP